MEKIAQKTMIFWHFTEMCQFWKEKSHQQTPTA